jgi:Tol biopolymer transport system component
MLASAIVCATLVLAACTSDRASSRDAASGPGSIGGARSPAQTGPPPGRLLIARITTEAPDLVTVAPDGSGEEPFVTGATFELRQVSPDGSRIAVVAASPEGPLVGGTIGVDGSGLSLFEPAGPSLNLACGVWTPDGGLACEGWDDRTGRNGLYTVAADGSDPRRLTRERDVPCDYAPDGSRLAFVRTDRLGTVGTLMVMDADGGNVRSLVGSVPLSGLPCDWSPDGRWILVGRSYGTLRLVSPDGSSEVLDGEGIDGFVPGGTWSPDGSRILFTMAVAPDASDVYTVAADGSDVVRVTDGDAYYEGGLWLP